MSGLLVRSAFKLAKEKDSESIIEKVIKQSEWEITLLKPSIDMNHP
jgi:hypothetical protein